VLSFIHYIIQNRKDMEDNQMFIHG
jgi:hypothetical protein